MFYVRTTFLDPPRSDSNSLAFAFFKMIQCHQNFPIVRTCITLRGEMLRRMKVKMKSNRDKMKY